MRILVDADGTNRIAPAIDIAKKYKIPIKLFCDCSHILHSNYAETVYSDTAPESTDITLLNQCRKGDIIITQDIGLAGIALAKGAKVIHCSGRILDNKQIDLALTHRAIKQCIRRNTKHKAQSRKVTFGFEHQKYNFYQNLVQLVEQARKDVACHEME